VAKADVIRRLQEEGRVRFISRSRWQSSRYEVEYTQAIQDSLTIQQSSESSNLVEVSSEEPYSTFSWENLDSSPQLSLENRVHHEVLVTEVDVESGIDYDRTCADSEEILAVLVYYRYACSTCVPKLTQLSAYLKAEKVAAASIGIDLCTECSEHAEAFMPREKERAYFNMKCRKLNCLSITQCSSCRCCNKPTDQVQIRLSRQPI
jgi:hypothetical protein